MTAYIIQVVSFQLLFLLVYELLLKKETFFSYNRWYLLVTAGASIMLPFVKIAGLSQVVPAESISTFSGYWLPEVFVGETSQNLTSAMESNRLPLALNWWLLIYALGVFGSFLLFLKKYRDLKRLSGFRTIASEKDLRIVEVPGSNIACTFFSTIFIGEKLSDSEKQHILPHELVHARQKHSADLLFFEILKIIFWFNPLVYIYQNRIAALHEFIADAAVVKTTEKRSYYEQLLNSAFNTSNISFINQFFNHSLIKKRILMLQKSKSKTVAKFRYLILVPLLLFMLTYVACSDEQPPAQGEITQIEERALYIKIEDFGNQSALEKEMINDAIEKMKNNPEYDAVHISDGKKTIVWSNNPETGKQEIVTENINGSITTEKRVNPDYKGDAVPFAVIDQVPVFPGCSDLGSNEEQKKCMSEKITEHVSGNFNTGLGKELGLKGVNRVIVQFKIDKDGNIQDVRSRAPHPDLEAEAERVINSLPQMQPGMQDGKAVAVMYSLPIVFQIN